MDLDRIGAWIWGTGTAVMAISALAVVIIGGLYLGPDGRPGPDTPWKIAGLYTVLKDCGTLVAGILGFSGLAWSNFFTVKK
jgi:hypothetical protein